MGDFIASIPLGLEVASVTIAAIIGYIGIAVMAYGGIRSGWHFVMSAIHNTGQLPNIRVELGRHLSLGLEFLVGKDIIETIVQPSWDELGKLAAIIAMRTVVTFMLSWELKRIKDELEEEKAHQKALSLMRKK